MTATPSNRKLLTGKQVRGIALLLQGYTIVSVADTLGVHESTIHKWRATPNFRAELNRATTDIIDASCSLLTSTRHKALNTLNNILDDVDAPPADRIKAAVAILQLPAPPPPDSRTCTVDGIQELESEASLTEMELLSKRFQL